jgi:hypothetical protein
MSYDKSPFGNLDNLVESDGRLSESIGDISESNPYPILIGQNRIVNRENGLPILQALAG